MAGVTLDTLKIGPHGPLYDRKWLVVDAISHRFLTQREYPSLATVVPHLKSDEGGKEAREDELLLEIPNTATVDLSRDLSVAPISTEVWSHPCLGQPANAEANEALSSYLGAPVRLIYICSQREPDGGEANLKFQGFADKYGLLLTNQASLEAVNTYLREENSPEWQGKLDFHRFRSNIQISGAIAGSENEASAVTIGTQAFKCVAPCPRCKMTLIDQDTGHERDKSLIKAIKKWKFIQGMGSIFGHYIVPAEAVHTQISISTGDTVCFL